MDSALAQEYTSLLDWLKKLAFTIEKETYYLDHTSATIALNKISSGFTIPISDISTIKIPKRQTLKELQFHIVFKKRDWVTITHKTPCEYARDYRYFWLWNQMKITPYVRPSYFGSLTP